ncbi:UNVERIFIED_CONTAM: hypothetical protein HDU68_002711 [Siphonaria sp. JEL0065]|nr:hypothetical protein HDU68_002711 [Siphonaria sp. JEL0065]
MKSVAVIGAGVSGLIAARHFLEDGWKVTVYEAGSEIGGVWSRASEFTCLQSPTKGYAIPGTAHETASEFASREELQRYFSGFAATHLGRALFVFRTRVVSLVRDVEAAQWRLSLVDWTGAVSEQIVDFVVSAQGVFSGPVNMPLIEGVDVFEGPVIHSTSVTRSLLTNCKSVVIVGAGKTSLDCLHLHSSISTSHRTHWVFRKAVWYHPLRMGGIFPILSLLGYRLIFTPLSVLWRLANEREYPVKKEENDVDDALEEGDAKGWTRLLLLYKTKKKKVDSGPSWFVRYLMGYRNGDSFRPTSSLAKQCTTAIQPPGLLDKIRNGVIQAHANTTITKFSPRTVHLSNDTQIDNVDAVVFATGTTQSMIVPNGFEHLVEHGGVFLYRHLVHPDIPDMVFLQGLGSNMTPTTISIALHWTTSLLRNEIKLPPKETQLEEIKKIKKESLKACTDNAINAANSVHFYKFCDQICLDLGISPLRKLKLWGRWAKWNPVAWLHEFFGEYVPEDYSFGVVDEEVRVAAAARRCIDTSTSVASASLMGVAREE